MVLVALVALVAGVVVLVKGARRRCPRCRKWSGLKPAAAKRRVGERAGAVGGTAGFHYREHACKNPQCGHVAWLMDGTVSAQSDSPSTGKPRVCTLGR